MKIWVDDMRQPPNDKWVWCKTVNEVIQTITEANYIFEANPESTHHQFFKIELISLDHDAGEYYYDGGDYIRILDWLEETGRNYPIHIHSMNPVGRGNMRRIIRKNDWEEIDFSLW